MKRRKVESDISGRQCTSDAQCVTFRHGDISKPQDASKASAAVHKARLGEYACINGSCRYVVKAGELCSSAFDCAAYQLNRRWSSAASLANNTTSSANKREFGADSLERTANQDGSQWCAPQFCTLESTCGGAWTLPGAPFDLPPGVDSDRPVSNGTVSCCRGFLANAQCGLYSGAVDTCDSGLTCATSRNAEAGSVRERSGLTPSHNMIVDLRQGVLDNSASHLDDGMPVGKCVSQEPHQQVWIGVLLVLIGGATLNIGLNLQKYAFRKREEKIQADAALQSSIDREKADALARSPSSPSDVYFYSSEVVHGSHHRLDQHDSSAETTRKAGMRPNNMVVASDVFPLSTHSNVKRTGTGLTLSETQMPAPLSVGHNTSHSTNGITEITNASGNRISLSAMDNVRLSYCSDLQLVQKQQMQDSQSRAKRQLWKTRLRDRIALRKKSNTPFSSPVWAVGLVIFILGNVVNFVALQFAPQSLVAPLGAVSLVTNVIVAPLLNNEKISMFDVGGIVLIIAGCVVVVVFSGIVQQNYRLCVLIQLLKAKPTIIYLCLIFGAILAIYVFLWSVERGVARYLQETHRIDDSDAAVDADTGELDLIASCHSQHVDQPHSAIKLRDISHGVIVDESAADKDNPDMESRCHHKLVNLDTDVETKRKSIDGLFTELDSSANHHIAADLSKAAEPFIMTETKPNGNKKSIESPRPAKQHIPVSNRLFKWLTRHPLMVLDPYIKPIRPTSRYVKYGLPLAYASLGSFMATLTTLFAKSLINLLSVSLFDHDNQFNHFISWAILLVTAFTAASQVYWINQGLLRYDALLQVPVFYVVWTVFDIIGGGVYFNEFKLFTTVKYVLFAIGVAVIFSGVGLLSHRMRT
ncbi:hypothetical protein GGF39_000920 [Coemansia sp. RSA 1721]|nr:hypothetical protein GGF39_000920 [Coemansia sp. RSA 1721]